MKSLLFFVPFLFVGASLYCSSGFVPQRQKPDYLEATTYINSEHPSVMAAMQEAIGDDREDTKKAVRIHDYVRERIKFGWSSAFYDQTASEVLEAGVGFCNTKSTLFIAMLRAAGIPARQHFVNINSRIIDRFISPGTDYVDHSYTEVYLEGCWIAVDSYIVDSTLFRAAQKKLEKEEMILGYGVHRNGSLYWDGKSDSFSQFVNDGSFTEFTTADFGVFSDVGAFYSSGYALNQLGIFSRFFFRFAAAEANQKIEQLRTPDGGQF